MSNKASVGIIYTHFPHYREAIFKELELSKKNDYFFYFGDGFKESKILVGHNILKSEKIFQFRLLGLFFQFLNIPKLLKHDCLIFLGNPNVISTWIYSLIFRMCKKKILFWTHGWISDEMTKKNFLRDFFYRLSDKLLLYGKRSYEIGLSRGFKKDSMVVIYNSLDVKKQLACKLHKTKSYKKYHVVLGRLTPELRLTDFFKILGKNNFKEKIIVVGEGSEKKAIERSVATNNLNVEFLGPCYDEQKLSGIIYNSRSVISPGKAGLVVMHALIYGSPVVTHNLPNNQMPEYEALTDGLDVGLFDWNEEQTVMEVFTALKNLNNENYFQKSRKKVIDFYNPKLQAKIIDNAVFTIS